MSLSEQTGFRVQIHFQELRKDLTRSFRRRIGQCDRGALGMMRGANGGECASKQHLFMKIGQDRKRKQYAAGRNKAACHIEKFARLGRPVGRGKEVTSPGAGADLGDLGFLFSNLPAQLIKNLLQIGQ
jgi:hypothetical protein